MQTPCTIVMVSWEDDLKELHPYVASEACVVKYSDISCRTSSVGAVSSVVFAWCNTSSYS